MLLIFPNFIAFCRVLSYPSYSPWACRWLWARSNPNLLNNWIVPRKLHIWPLPACQCPLFIQTFVPNQDFLSTCFQNRSVNNMQIYQITANKKLGHYFPIAFSAYEWILLCAIETVCRLRKWKYTREVWETIILKDSDIELLFRPLDFQKIDLFEARTRDLTS